MGFVCNLPTCCFLEAGTCRWNVGARQEDVSERCVLLPRVGWERMVDEGVAGVVLMLKLWSLA